MGLRRWVLAVAASGCALAVSTGAASAAQVQSCPGSGFDYPDRFTYPVAPEGFAPDCQYEVGSAFVDVRTGTPTVNIDVSGGISVDSRGRLLRFNPPIDNILLFDVSHSTGVIAAVRQPGGATSLTYDAAGRLTRIPGDEGATIVSYDSAGRVSEDGDTHGYEKFVYDATGRLTGWRDSVGDTATLSYDFDGRLTSAVTTLSGTTTTDSYTFDSASDVTSWTTDQFGSPDTLTFTHNSNGDVTTVRDGTTTDANLSYVAPHKLSAVTNGSTTYAAFTYNDLHQLVTATSVGSPLTFAYDSAGRLARTTGEDGTQTYGYDALGRLNDLTGEFGPVTIAYLPGPSALSGTASSVKSAAATLHGTVNPHSEPTTYHFQYGRTKAYGHSTKALAVAGGTIAVAVKALLKGLKPSTTYHYRLVAANTNGAGTGADHTFKTKGLLCHVPNLKGDTLKQAKAALNHAHCKLGKVHKPKHGNHLKVVSQHPSAGTTKPAGSKVNVKLTKS